jgi:hypothetical protein
MTQLERNIYEVRRLVGFAAVMYELTLDGCFTVCFTAPDGRRGRIRMRNTEPRNVAEAVRQHLARTPIPQPAAPSGP